MSRQCLSVCSSAGMISETTEEISIKFGTGTLHQKLSGKTNFDLYSFNIIHTDHKDRTEFS
jgi:hypothetical protein